MIHIFNLSAGPLVLIVRLIDVYLFVASVRLLLEQFEGASVLAACRTLQRFTDPLPRALHTWLTRRRRRPPPTWAAWLIVFLSGLALRYLVLAIILTGF
ncbi:hypothetical protein [Anaerobaca lacustris]|uniref:YggT family protein n=1 Tax=Anaerobaca lacustris TaxID=3044600 RepID=A0AAW6U859_9BACT|nr:hypothetical protein [Sedimentisphaerales bacterium M17dextr]